MKIGVCVNFESIDNMFEKFKNMVDNGFDDLQLICWDPELFTTENAQTIATICKNCGVTISSFWCGWVGPKEWNFYEGPLTLGLVPEKWRDIRVKNLCDGADFAKEMGVNKVVTHMGFIPEDPNHPDFLPFCDAVRKVAEHCKHNGQYLLFETGQETPVTMLRCFETVACDNLGVNLDTANLILYGKADPVAALDVFGKYVMNLHAKDGKYPTSGKYLGIETPLGQGKVDFKGVLSKLHSLGFDGSVTIEREISGDEQLRDILSAKKYLQDIIDHIEGASVLC